MTRNIDIPWIKVLTCVIFLAYFVQAGPVEEEKSEERIIGYGLTNTGFTVLATALIGVLGLAYFSSAEKQRKRKSGFLQRRQEFLESCNINPHLKPHCIQKLQKRRKQVPRK